ncbi:hypothetical protein BGX23_002403, partial [Mortierella sp. AD031]
MNYNPLTLFCLVDGEAATNAFRVEIESTKTIGDLKKLTKVEKAPCFDDVAADDLSLWRVSIPDDDNDDEILVVLDNVKDKDKKKLKATRELSEVFPDKPPKTPFTSSFSTLLQVMQIHALVPVPLRARSSTPGLDSSRPGTPLTGDLHVDIKKITDKFFSPGTPVTNYLDAFVRGQGTLPVTTGAIRGLPRAWRRAFGKPAETRPSLLFLDLPDPLAPDSLSRNLASTSILDMVKENNGCGKTRAVIELLSQHWGFYFNASSDDWGSNDLITLHSTVQKCLNETRVSSTVTRQDNSAYARKTTLMLFLSRLLIFKYCLNVPDSILKLRHHFESVILDLVHDVYEDAKGCIIKHGCLPKFRDDTRLLVVHDEAQFLGDEFNGSFQSMSSSEESPRPLLSPILHAFRDIGGHQLTLVTCGTGLSINTLYWVQSSGSGLKDSSTNFEYMELPGWKDQQSIKAYVSLMRITLPDGESRQALDERLPQEAIGMLFEKFAGRFRPAAVAMEKIVEGNKRGPWKVAIEDTEDKLLVEHAFGRIKIIQGHAVTVLDEPFVSKAVENYFVAMDPYFKKETRRQMLSTSAPDQGCMFEHFMMSVFSETFKARPLSEWPHQPAISEMCRALVGKVKIVGWKEPGFEQGTTHKNMSMKEFTDAHVNHQSTFNNKPVAPFFFPKSWLSGPDMVFFLQIDGSKVVPAFAQMKLHQKSSSFSERGWENTLSTVSAKKITNHANDFQQYCPDKVYISMIVAYPTKWTSKLPTSSNPIFDASGVQQVVINVGDNNFGEIFPKEHIEFIDKLKNAGRHSATDDDDGD